MTAGLGLRGDSISNFDPKPYKMYFLLHFYATFQQKSGGKHFLEGLQGVNLGITILLAVTYVRLTLLH